MQKVLKSGNFRLYALIGSVVVVALAWRAGDAVHQHLRNLPIKEAPRVDRGSKPINTRSFYSVWVKQPAAMPAPAAPQAGEIDALFMKKEEPKAEALKPAEPDYAQLFMQRITVDGVSNDGAFINGRFFKIREPMSDLNLPGPLPFIESISATHLNFVVGTVKVSFQTGGR